MRPPICAGEPLVPPSMPAGYMLQNFMHCHFIINQVTMHYLSSQEPTKRQHRLQECNVEAGSLATPCCPMVQVQFKTRNVVKLAAACSLQAWQRMQPSPSRSFQDRRGVFHLAQVPPIIISSYSRGQERLPKEGPRGSGSRPTRLPGKPWTKDCSDLRVLIWTVLSFNSEPRFQERGMRQWWMRRSQTTMAAKGWYCPYY